MKDFVFEGTVEKVVYRSEGYSVYALDIDENLYPELKKSKYGNVTICGDLHSLDFDQAYIITAYEKSSDKNGYSYFVKNIRARKPVDEKNVLMFLRNAGVTQNQAYELYREYPDIIDRVIENRVDDIDLNKLHGIGTATFDKIKIKIVDNYVLCDLVEEYGNTLTNAMFRAIYSHYTSVERVKEEMNHDPYKLFTRLARVGFKTADVNIMKLEKAGKIKLDEPVKCSYSRCKAFIEYTIEESEANGNTCMDIMSLRRKVVDGLPECAKHFVKAVQSGDFYLNTDLKLIAKNSFARKEKYIADKIKYAIANPIVWDFDWQPYTKLNGFDLSDEQGSALPCILNNSIMLLNGPGGTGKSSTVEAILNLLKANGKSYKLMAPTAKAANVLKEYTKESAETIHRGLGFNPLGGFLVNHDAPFAYDVIIADEESMTDVALMYNMLDGIDFNKTKLILVGDDAQLPSVGPGNVFHDLLESKIVPTVTLTKVFRYGEGGLMTVATDCRNGKPWLDNITQQVTKFGKNEDYTFIEIPQTNIIQSAVALYKKCLMTYNKEQIMVLSSYNTGDYGVETLNKALQKAVNPNYGADRCISIGDTTYHIDDIVMQCKNNYKAPLFTDEFDELFFDKPPETLICNGETGVLISIEGKHCVIDFSGTKVVYDTDQLLKCQLGYAMTIHKSQGGSAKAVILLTPTAHTFMLNSNLLYVGLTRMKEVCYHLGNKSAVNKAVKKKANLERQTMLGYYLKN